MNILKHAVHMADLPHCFRWWENQKSLCLTLCRSNLKPYCMGRKAAFFQHLNLCTTPETGLPSR